MKIITDPKLKTKVRMSYYFLKNFFDASEKWQVIIVAVQLAYGICSTPNGCGVTFTIGGKKLTIEGIWISEAES